MKHDDPEVVSISHIHVLLLSSAISLIVSPTLPSWLPVLILLSAFYQSACSLGSGWQVQNWILFGGGERGGFVRCAVHLQSRKKRWKKTQNKTRKKSGKKISPLNLSLSKPGNSLSTVRSISILTFERWPTKWRQIVFPRGVPHAPAQRVKFPCTRYCSKISSFPPCWDRTNWYLVLPSVSESTY